MMTETPHPSTWEAECAAMRAENERLRAALATIRVTSKCNNSRCAARAALEAKP